MSRTINNLLVPPPETIAETGIRRLGLIDPNYAANYLIPDERHEIAEAFLSSFHNIFGASIDQPNHKIIDASPGRFAVTHQIEDGNKVNSVIAIIERNPRLLRGIAQSIISTPDKELYGERHIFLQLREPDNPYIVQQIVRINNVLPIKEQDYVILRYVSQKLERIQKYVKHN